MVGPICAVHPCQIRPLEYARSPPEQPLTQAYSKQDPQGDLLVAKIPP